MSKSNRIEILINDSIEELEIMYCLVTKCNTNSEFLFEIELADNMEIERLNEALTENDLTVFIQNDVIKIPSNTFTTSTDFEKLVNCFRLCVSF